MANASKRKQLRNEVRVQYATESSMWGTGEDMGRMHEAHAALKPVYTEKPRQRHNQEEGR